MKAYKARKRRCCCRSPIKAGTLARSSSFTVPRERSAMYAHRKAYTPKRRLASCISAVAQSRCLVTVGFAAQLVPFSCNMLVCGALPRFRPARSLARCPHIPPSPTHQPSVIMAARIAAHSAKVRRRPRRQRAAIPLPSRPSRLSGWSLLPTLHGRSPLARDTRATADVAAAAGS